MIWRTLPLSRKARRYKTNAMRATWSRGNIGIREHESGYLRAKGTDGKAHRWLTMAEINNAWWRRNWHRLILGKMDSSMIALQCTVHAASHRSSKSGCGFHGHKNSSVASENVHVDAVASEDGKLGGKTYA